MQWSWRKRQSAVFFPLSLGWFLVLLTLFGSSTLLFAQEPLPQLLWRRSLGGDILGPPAQGPGGDVYVVSEDRGVHCLIPETGQTRWVYRPGGRLKGQVLAAPDGTIYVQNDEQELFAVTPGGSGRWKWNMGGGSAALPTIAPDGRLILPMMGGKIVCLSRQGKVLWEGQQAAEASASPVVDEEGWVWIPLSNGEIVSYSPSGAPGIHISFGSPISMLAFDDTGRLWVGGFHGAVLRASLQTQEMAPLKSSQSGEKGNHSFVSQGQNGNVETNSSFYVLSDVSQAKLGESRVVSLLLGPLNLVILADGDVVELGEQLQVISRHPQFLSGGGASLSLDSTLYMPSADGKLRQFQTDSEVLLFPSSAGSHPLITDSGILISGGTQWVLSGWAVSPPASGWSQFRGDAGRTGQYHGVPESLTRQEARLHPGFFYRETLALSNDVAHRLQLIEEMESYGDSLFKELYGASLLLEDLAYVGTVRTRNSYQQPLSSHPLVRIRAYTLIGKDEDFRSRNLLLTALQHEDDQAALASGFRALGALGSDWDGAAVRLMKDRYTSFSHPEERLIMATAQTLLDLAQYNGGLTDSAGAQLITLLLNAPLGRAQREEVLSIALSIAGA